MTKQEIKDLKNQLLRNESNGINRASKDDLDKVNDFSEGYKKFLNSSKTERESVITSKMIAEKFGFKEFKEGKKYSPGDKIYFINREKSIIFTIIGKNGLKNGAKIAVAHIDSPRLDLKPNPLYQDSDLALLKTHYYGGIKKYQWTAIPLALHGKIVKKNGEEVNVCIGENDEDVHFCITDLLPHLAKEQMGKTMLKSFTGEDLNVLIGSKPLEGEGTELVKLNIMKLLNETYGIIEPDFLSAELEIVPAFKAVDVGFDRSLVGSYGHDDRVCAYSALMATMDSDVPENTVITVLADKEEIGSDGNTGMKSMFFKYFIADLAAAEGLKARHVLSKSQCLSADVNAAFDPNYSSVFEKNNSSFINGGAVITKYTGSGGKSGTSDASAEFVAKIRRVLEENNVVWQAGELGKVDAGGGGTIAKFIANLNVDVVDLGVPVLSMHAPFEIVSKFDVFMAYKTFKVFFEN